MKHGIPLSVTSEIGRLREAIVHAPGREIEMVTPRNFERMLFDDILYRKAAAKEHDCLIKVLKKAGIEVFYFLDLLAETLHLIGDKRRKEFVQFVSQLEGCPPEYCKLLLDYSPEGLADVLIGGEPREESLTRFLRRDIYALSPLPNMMFVRDCATVVGDAVVLSSMAHAVRSREVLLLSLVFKHHPHFCYQGIAPWHWLGDFRGRLSKEGAMRGQFGFERISLRGTNFRLSSPDGLSIGGKEYAGTNAQVTSGDKSVTLQADYVRFTQGPQHTLEGGNIFILSPEILLVGCGQRASAAAIDRLARDLFGRRSRIRTILVAIVAGDKDSHLDTFFSIVDRDQYVIHPPVMEEYGAQLTMFKMWLDKGRICVQAYDSMKEALESENLKYEERNVAYCAGVTPFSGGWMENASEIKVDDRIAQEREWHNQALNMLPLAPGILIASQRNEKTLKHLQEQWGYERFEAEEFLDELEEGVLDEWLQCGKRAVITLDDSELLRGHGGPRSLVLPLRRDEVDDGPFSVHVKSPLKDAEREHAPQSGSDAPDLREIQLNVRSETGRLRQVVLHTPGKEIARLSPTNHDALLYDDVLDLKRTQKEHGDFSELLRALDITVYEVENLIANALRGKERLGDVFDLVADLQKEAVEERGGKWLPSYKETLKTKLAKTKGVEELSRMLIAGVTADSSHPALFLDDADPFLLTPIPNIMFMRDPAAVVGDNAIVCYMQKPARLREGLLLHYALQALVDQEIIPRDDLWFDHFRDVGILEERGKSLSGDRSELEAKKRVLEEQGKRQRVEGGDILVIHEHILAIGCSERTTRETLERLATKLFSVPRDVDPRIHEIFVVLMPAQRSAMHLDTIFTMVSEDECLVYEPMVMPQGVEQVRVVRVVPDRNQEGRLEGIKTQPVNSLIKELERAIAKYENDPNYKLMPILTGGDNPLYQDREQFYDGANVLAIAPGVIIGYERNYRTFRELERAGYRVYHARDVMQDEELKRDILQAMESSIPGKRTYQRYRGKYAIAIEGRELSRARGGPRCMSMPLQREDISWDRSGRSREKSQKQKLGSK